MNSHVFEVSKDKLSEISALTLLDNFPLISFERAVRKVRNGNYRTIGKRGEQNELEIFLCLPSGKPVAIVDFPVARSEVSE